MTQLVPVLETNGLCVAVPARKNRMILADISLALHGGEILGMVGESGSGKTTFGQAVMGLVRPSAGTITLDGQALAGSSAKEFRPLRRAAALLFQDPAASFNPRLRIGAIVGEPRRIAGIGRVTTAELATLVERAGLSASVLRKFPHALSGGQARRAAVARALAVVPRLIIADEPTAGLDVSVQGGILNLFLDIREQGTALLLISHNLAVIRHVSDRLAILYLGRLVEIGPTDAIFRAPRHPYTRALLDAEPEADPARRRTEPPLMGEVPSIFARPAGCEFHARCRFVRPRCRDEAPGVTGIGERHSVRCHFPLGGG